VNEETSGSSQVRRCLLAIAALTLSLGLALLAGWKGLLCGWGDLRISLRAPGNPLVVALASTLVAWSLAPKGRRRQALADDARALWRGLRTPVVAASQRAEPVRTKSAAAIAAIVAILAVVVAFREGAPVAGGSDSYGYVSQAHLWATGKLRVEPPLLDLLDPVLPSRALAPLGYVIARDAPVLVPTYSPGLPMVMAVFERLAGARAVFWVVPLLGGVAVWATYLLGRHVMGPLAGALAAVLVATSPAFLFQLTGAPMSDLAAAAWWTLALALLFSPARFSALGSGLAAAVAILTRPNLVPVAIVPGLYLLIEAIRERLGSSPERRQAALGERDRSRPTAAPRLLGYVVGVVPGCLAVAAVNTHLYGSPLASGYDVKGLFGLEHALPNLARYPVLATEMHTPLIWLGVVAPMLAFGWGREASSIADRRRLWVLLWFVVAVFACYLFYPGFDAHWRLRFLLPAVPALLVSTAAALVALARRLPPRWSTAVAAVVAAVVAWHGVTYARERAAFDTEGEFRYEIIGDYIARELPQRAVLFAMQHSGSVRYYSGRPMVRYDQVPKRRLDRVIALLRRNGYASYLVLDGWEEKDFRKRFGYRSSFGHLDWPPSVELEVGDVRIYDAADRGPQPAGEQRTTKVLPWPFP
jgi:hypothetical protein